MDSNFLKIPLEIQVAPIGLGNGKPGLISDGYSLYRLLLIKDILILAPTPPFVSSSGLNPWSRVYSLRYGTIEELKAQGGEILASSKGGGGLYGESFLQGTHVLYAIKEEPGHYGLNKDPKVPLSVIVWKQFIQPIGT